MVALAVLMAVLGLLLGGTWREWAYQALVILVIACPCALVVSTPVTVVSGLAAAARHGILIKGGVFLEGGRKLKANGARQDRHLDPGQARADRCRSAGRHADRAGLADRRQPGRPQHPSGGARPGAGVARTAAGHVLVAHRGFSRAPRARRPGVIDGQEWTLGITGWRKSWGSAPQALEARLTAFGGAGRTAVVLIAPSGPVAMLPWPTRCGRKRAGGHRTQGAGRRNGDADRRQSFDGASDADQLGIQDARAAFCRRTSKASSTS